MKHLTLLVPILLLTSCAGAPVGWGGKHEILLANEATISIRYDTMLASEKSIFSIAEEHCVSYDKHAVATETSKSTGITTQTFECR